MSKSKSRRIPHPIWFGVAAVLMVVLSAFLSVWLPYHSTVGPGLPADS